MNWANTFVEIVWSCLPFKLQVYTGKPDGGEKSRVSQGHRGHNVKCNSFFTSYPLGQDLLKRKRTTVGTTRKSRAVYILGEK